MVGQVGRPGHPQAKQYEAPDTLYGCWRTKAAEREHDAATLVGDITGLALEADRPGYVLDALGRCRRGFQAGGLGGWRSPRPGPVNRPEQADCQRSPAAIGAAPGSGPPTAAATVNRPPSAPHSRDLAAWLARLERASG
jgi:hypothetical protein